METLLEDSEVKVLLMNKMRQLGLAGALA